MDDDPDDDDPWLRPFAEPDGPPPPPGHVPVHARGIAQLFLDACRNLKETEMPFVRRPGLAPTKPKDVDVQPPSAEPPKDVSPSPTPVAPRRLGRPMGRPQPEAPPPVEAAPPPPDPADAEADQIPDGMEIPFAPSGIPAWKTRIEPLSGMSQAERESLAAEMERTGFLRQLAMHDLGIWRELSERRFDIPF